MQVIRKWLNKYFEFSKREFNGLLVLIVLISLVAIFPPVYRALVPLKEPTAEEEELLFQLARANEKTKTSEKVTDQRTAPRGSEKRKSSLFYFDPNVIDSKGWQQLGLSKKQAGTILNYRAKAGVFRKPSDLKKMYTIAPELYKRLEPYIQIQVQEKKVAPSAQHVPQLRPKEKIMVELNAADTLELDRLPGIGKVFAKRIVAYRERIGGFYKKEQLLEVFGVDSLKFQEIRAHVVVNTGLLKKINVNTAAAVDFKHHPYLRYQQINALIAYRKQHGNYSNIADLNKVLILTPELIEKLAPYLIF